MAKKITQLTSSGTLSGSELFETVQNSSSLSVSAGRIRRYIEENSFMSGYKNKIINGNFDAWQRDTTQTSSGYGSDDRWRNTNSGTTKVHTRQSFTVGQTDVPNNPEYYSRTVVTSVAGAGNSCSKNQYIEGVRTFSGETCTLTFWAKADGSKNIATEFYQHFGSDGSPSSVVNGIGVTTHNLTTSWQKFTTSINIPSISGKTLGTNNNDFLNLSFWFDAGSNFNARTNSLGQQSGTFELAGVQLEKGNIATEFEHRHIHQELTLCQRYYEKSYNINTVPASITETGVWQVIKPDGDDGFHIPFSVVKRTAPTVVIYSSVTGTAGKVRNSKTGADDTASSSGIGQTGFRMDDTAAANGVGYRGHWTAYAEL